MTLFVSAFKAKEAMAMLKRTVQWRRDFDVEGLLGEEFSSDLDSVVYIYGVDRDGCPVCYNAYGEFQRKELYNTAFSDARKRERFLRWRIQFLEKFIRQHLDFSPGGICSVVQVNDLKNTPGRAKRELRQTTNQAVLLMQDNYPEFVAKQVMEFVAWLIDTDLLCILILLYVYNMLGVHQCAMVVLGLQSSGHPFPSTEDEE